MLKCMSMLFGFAAVAAFGQPLPLIYSASGSDAKAIESTVEAFRTEMGPLNTPGPTGDPKGRREINWDGVPAQFTTPNDLPADFFNKTSMRGVNLSSPRTGDNIRFQVSAAEGQTFFSNLVPEYAEDFKAFSPGKLFISLGIHDYDVDFMVPGTDQPAVTRGFGAVFTNVGVNYTSTVEVFDADNNSLGKFAVQVAAKGLSFFGVAFADKIIAKARVTPGNIAAGQRDNISAGLNIVAMDDFIFGEPEGRNVIAGGN